MSSGSEGAGLPVYPWRAAPPHLKTRRQLRALGRAPGRQDVAGTMILPRRHRVAYLYDLDKSVPRRAATPAQLDALARANLERQVQAAARRGYTREDLHTVGDPGPGWNPDDDARIAAHAKNLHARADAAHTALRDCGAQPPVLAAVRQWRGDPPTAADAGRYVAGEPRRRDELTDRLADLNLPESASRPVEFVLAYLDGHLDGVDLLRTPRLIDPAIAARARVDTLLGKFAEHGGAFGPALVNETALLSPPDQRRVRHAAHQVIGGYPVAPLWPDHVDRDQLAASLRHFTRAARTHPGALEAEHAQVTALLRGKGLHVLEQVRIREFLADTVAGAPPHAALLLIDERSKQRLDIARSEHAARLPAAHAIERVHELLGPRATRGLTHAVAAIGTDITWLAHGRHSAPAMSERRGVYHQHLARLMRRSRTEQLPIELTAQIREVLETAVRAGARHGTERTDREHQWAQRLSSPPVDASSRLITATRPTRTAERAQDQPVPAALPPVDAAAAVVSEVAL